MKILQKILTASLFAILARVIPSSLAWATPSIEQKMLIDVPVGNELTNYVVYHDFENKSRFWWVPYRMVVAKNPGLGTPRITWTPFTSTPRISLVASLARPSVGVEKYVREEIAKTVGLPEAEIFLDSLMLTDMALVLRFGREEGSVYGEWGPKTSIIVQNVPESIVLSEEENELLLKASKYGMAGLRVAVGFHGVFPAMKTPRHATRDYSTSCVAKEILGKKTPEESTGKIWSTRKLMTILSRLDVRCVTGSIYQGEGITSEELMESWESELVRTGLFQRQENGWALGTLTAWQIFLAKTSEAFSVIFPEEISLYPVEFGMLATELKATEF